MCNAPIILFGYNRETHLSRCWKALSENPLASKSEIFIFLDGPKSNSDLDAVLKTRKEAQKIKGFKRRYFYFSHQNKGLSNSIINGIKLVSQKSPCWIVVEDDLFVQKFFLEFMNDGLACYSNDGNVASIHGYTYPTEQTLPETFFIKGADCWGWGSWNRAWKRFNPDGKKLFKLILKSKSLQDFTYNNKAPFLKILKDQSEGKNDSWAIRWHASAFLANMYTLYPGRSLVQNMGFDLSGTHCDSSTVHNVALSKTKIQLERLPICESLQGRKAFEKFFRGDSKKKKWKYFGLANLCCKIFKRGKKSDLV